MARILEGSSLPAQVAEFDFEQKRIVFPETQKHMAFSGVDTYEIKKKDDTTSIITIKTLKGANVIIECSKEDGKYFQSEMILIKL